MKRVTSIVGFMVLFALAGPAAAREASAPVQGGERDGMRVLRFPETHSVGWVYVHDKDSPFPLYNTPFPWFRWNWRELGRARGEVEVPEGTLVRLIVSPLEDVAKEDFAGLNADDIDYLSMMLGDNNAYPPGTLVLRSASGLCGLKALSFVDTKLDAGAIQSLARCFPELEALALRVPGLTLDKASQVSKLRQLHALQISGDVSAQQLKQFAGMPHLRAFFMSPYELHPETASALALFPVLEHLELHCSEIGAEALEPIAGLPALRRLHFHNAELDAEELRVLARHPALEELDIVHWLDDAGMEAVSGFPALKRLELSGEFTGGAAYSFTHVGLKHLTACKTLESLRILYGRTDDEGVIHLARMPNLRHVWLGLSRSLTDETLKAFSRSKSIEELHLDSAHYTREGFRHLANCPSLRTYWLTASRPDHAELVRFLRKTLPGVEIRTARWLPSPEEAAVVGGEARQSTSTATPG